MRQVFGFESGPNNKELGAEDRLRIYWDWLQQKDPDFYYGFIQTGVKILGRSHVKKQLELHRLAHEKFPGLFKAFDLVHYEDSMLLEEIADLLKEFADKHS